MSDENNVQIEQTNTPADNNEGEGQVQENNQNIKETGSEGDGGGEDAPKETQEPPKKDKMRGWAQHRIDELSAKNHQERQRAEALQKQTEELLSELATARSKGDGDKEGLSRVEIDRLAAIKAEEIANNKLNKARGDDLADRVWNDGLKEFPDFAESISTLRNSFGERFDNVAPMIIEALEKHNPHRVLHHLGENLDEAARILSLSPAKQLVELTRLESSLGKQEKPISKVPAPPKTIDGKGKAESRLDDPKLSMEEFNRIRNQELISKGKRLY